MFAAHYSQSRPTQPVQGRRKVFANMLALAIREIPERVTPSFPLPALID